MTHWTTKPTSYAYKGHHLIVRKVGLIEVLPFWSDWLLAAPVHSAASLGLAMTWVDKNGGH